MRPTLPLFALLALTLVASACNSDVDATDECPDAPCDWQFGESGADGGSEDPAAEWQPPERPPLPDSEVVIELAWDLMVPPGDDSDYYQGDLNLFYCNSQQDSYGMALSESDCVHWDNTEAQFQPDNAEAVQVTMVNTPGYTDPPKYVVHDALPSGRTHILAKGYNHTHPMRAHARVYLAGELVWENSQDVGSNDIQTPWYAGYIDWNEDLAQVTISEGIPCSEAEEPECHEEHETLYEFGASVRFAQN